MELARQLGVGARGNGPARSRLDKLVDSGV